MWRVDRRELPAVYGYKRLGMSLNIVSGAYGHAERPYPGVPTARIIHDGHNQSYAVRWREGHWMGEGCLL